MNEYMAKPFLLRMNLQLFAEDGGAGGTGGEGGSGGDGKGGGAGGGEKTFTQAELDAAVTSRLTRAEKAAKTALAKEFGFDSVEAMQAALKKPEDKKKDEDKKTDPVDVDKIVEAKLKEQNDKTFKRLLAAEVKVLANELGFADWEDAHALADLSKVEEDDKGNLTGVKEALEELLKKKPHLGKQKTGNGAFGAHVGGGSGGGDDKTRREALIKEAQGRGVIPQNQSVHNPWA